MTNNTSGSIEIDPSAHARPSAAEDTEWIELEGVGQVFRRIGGPALVVSPVAVGERMQQVMPRLWTFDSRAWLGEIDVPTLVLCGTADPVVPVEHARRVHQRIAGSRFLAVEGAGHVPTAERSRAVVDAWSAFRTA